MPGVTAIKVGGHFEGSMVLHWDGHLFIADTFVNVPVSCMILSEMTKLTLTISRGSTVKTDQKVLLRSHSCGMYFRGQFLLDAFADIGCLQGVSQT